VRGASPLAVYSGLSEAHAHDSGRRVENFFGLQPAARSGSIVESVEDRRMEHQAGITLMRILVEVIDAAGVEACWAAALMHATDKPLASSNSAR